jgi:hypothetical protein
MKKLWLNTLVLGVLALASAGARADIKETCISTSTCGDECPYIGWIEQTYPDGSTSGMFGGCCVCI